MFWVFFLASYPAYINDHVLNVKACHLFLKFIVFTPSRTFSWFENSAPKAKRDDSFKMLKIFISFNSLL